MKYIKEDKTCFVGRNKWECKECNALDGDEGKANCHRYKELYRKLFKLKDHIELEFIRLSEIRRESDRMKQAYLDVDEKIRESNINQENLFDQQKNLKNEMKDDIKNINIQVVSVLGIFAAVIVAVFGGLNVFGMSFVGDNNLGQIIFSLSTGLFFVFNIVFTVLWFIAKINLRENLPKGIWWSFGLVNLCCIIGAIFGVNMIIALSAY